MKHYCDYIPLSLAEKLKEKGMPIYLENDGYWGKTIKSPTYAEVFDWLMEKGISMDLSTRAFFIVWDKDGNPSVIKGKTWHEAAEKAIEKALTLI